MTFSATMMAQFSSASLVDAPRCGKANDFRMGHQFGRRKISDVSLQLAARPMQPSRPHRRRRRRARSLSVPRFRSSVPVDRRSPYFGSHPSAAHARSRSRRAGKGGPDWCPLALHRMTAAMHVRTVIDGSNPSTFMPRSRAALATSDADRSQTDYTQRLAWQFEANELLLACLDQLCSTHLRSLSTN